MNQEIRWLVRLGVEQGCFNREQCRGIRKALGDEAGLMDFAQKLIDDAIFEDIDRLEKLAADALTSAKAGPVPDDPFSDAAAPAPAAAQAPAPVEKPAPVPAPASQSTPPFSRSRAPFPKPSLSAAEASATGAAPSFDFSRLSSLSDEQLSEGLGNLLRATALFGASDLHLSAGARPFYRKHRSLIHLSAEPLAADDALRLNTVLLAPHQRRLFLERCDYDYALALDNSSRYRVNLMFHKGGAAGAYRMVPARIPRLGDLGLRNLDVIRKLLTYHNGLVLVTGPVGAGKTTTLAALVAELNENREDHIITVEDPIEVVQPARRCNVTQREVGPHTRSFATALKGALREDPDVIVIGELRDLETVEMAITAAETGHLVIGTMHTSDAATTLNRLLDVFPSAQQSQIRASVAESLRGILCQRLLPTPDGGLVLACELLVSTPAVSNLIREGKTQGLRNVMETGLKEGMCLMESVVFELYQQRKITGETALANINNRVLQAKITA
jgi:twitching motility protein PilT